MLFCFFYLSVQYNLPHKADWKALHTGLEYHALQLDIALQIDKQSSILKDQLASKRKYPVNDYK